MPIEKADADCLPRFHDESASGGQQRAGPGLGALTSEGFLSLASNSLHWQRDTLR